MSSHGDVHVGRTLLTAALSSMDEGPKTSSSPTSGCSLPLAGTPQVGPDGGLDGAQISGPPEPSCQHDVDGEAANLILCWGGLEYIPLAL